MDNSFDEKLAHLYYEVFERNAAGVAILENLWSVFYEAQATHPLDPYQLAYLEGQRSVIQHIRTWRDAHVRLEAAKGDAK